MSRKIPNAEGIHSQVDVREVASSQTHEDHKAAARRCCWCANPAEHCEEQARSEIKRKRHRIASSNGERARGSRERDPLRQSSQASEA